MVTSPIVPPVSRSNRILDMPSMRPFRFRRRRGPDQTVLLQTGRYGRIGADIRLDYNPKCGRAGFQQILSVLGRVLPREDLTVFLTQAKVTRLDLAIDLPDLTLNDAIVRLKSTRKHGVYTSPRGEPETTYLGGARSNRAVAYNKPADCKAMPSRLRIERRLKPGVRLPELINLSNPFSGVIAVATAPLRPLITEIHPDILFDSMRTRGIQRALNLLSSPQRRILTGRHRRPRQFPDAIRSRSLGAMAPGPPRCRAGV